MKKVLVVTLSFLVGCSPKITYPDSKLPANTPAIFAPGVISIAGEREGSIVFSPGSKELFFTKVVDDRTVIWTSQYRDGSWTKPSLWNVGSEASITNDGKQIFFIANKNIHRSIKVKDVWQPAESISKDVKTNKGLWFPSSNNGREVYFGAYLDSLHKSDIYLGVISGNSFNVSNAGDLINSNSEEWDPYISPDGSYLLFESDRTGGLGGTDIYVSFRKGNAWGAPINLGPEINTKAYEVAATVSPDGRYLFFNRSMRTEQEIWWVSTDVIKKLR